MNCEKCGSLLPVGVDTCYSCGEAVVSKDVANEEVKVEVTEQVNSSFESAFESKPQINEEIEMPAPKSMESAVIEDSTPNVKISTSSMVNVFNDPINVAIPEEFTTEVQIETPVVVEEKHDDMPTTKPMMEQPVVTPEPVEMEVSEPVIEETPVSFESNVPQTEEETPAMVPNVENSISMEEPVMETPAIEENNNLDNVVVENNISEEMENNEMPVMENQIPSLNNEIAEQSVQTEQSSVLTEPINELPQIDSAPIVSQELNASQNIESTTDAINMVASAPQVEMPKSKNKTLFKAASAILVVGVFFLVGFIAYGNTGTISSPDEPSTLPAISGNKETTTQVQEQTTMTTTPVTEVVTQEITTVPTTEVSTFGGDVYNPTN